MKAKLVIDNLNEANSIYDERENNGDRFTRNIYADRHQEKNWGRDEKDRAPVPAAPKLPKERKPRKKYPPALWNKRKYEKWVKDMSWYEGDEVPSDFGYEMAQNANHEPGLLNYMYNVIKKEGESGMVDPLERIQWDIEGAMSESNLPVGSDYDSRAPYNEQNLTYELIRDSIGIGMQPNDSNDETIYIEDVVLDELIANELGLDYMEMEEDGDVIEILDVENDNNNALIRTNHGNVSIPHYELLNI